MEFKVGFEAVQIVAGPNEDRLLDRTIQNCENHTATIIGTDAFTRCRSLERVVFPAVETVGEGAFYHCDALVHVYLPKAVRIQYRAFIFCEALERVRLPEVTFIGQAAFQSCLNLHTLIIEQADRVCFLGPGVFTLTPISDGTGFIYVPDELVGEYKSANNWSTYAAQIKPLSELSE